MNFNIIFYVGLLLCIGLGGAKLIRRLRLPAVTGYLIAGLLVGPYVTKIVPVEVVETLGFLSTVALGFIAFSIGGEFKMSYFKRVGLTPVVIAITESFGAVILVITVLVLAGFDLPFSIMLGAIAAATAPAATVMVIKQYRAKGIVTETLLSVVAIDDATALMAFALSTAIAQSMMSGNSGNILSSMATPIMEIAFALLIGAVLAFIFAFVMKTSTGKNSQLTLTVGFVLIAVGLAKTFNLSELLTCMAFGAVFTNLYNASEKIMQIADDFTPPLLLLFFVLSGAELNLAILPQIGLVGILYVVFRVIGKYFGAAFGAKIMHADERIVKYLGPALVPQAGVAIGLSLVATTVVPEFGAQIRAVILCGTLIYELVGPAIAKWALTQAGEIAKGA